MTYVFRCQDCNKVFEVSGTFDVVLQHYSCPDCKSENTKKVITVPAVHLKGSGWASKPDEKGLWNKK